MASIAQTKIESDKLLEFPRYLQIETISVCNARCSMCLTRYCKRDVTTMTEEMFKKITDELKDYSVDIERVTIQVAGEPLLDKKLEHRIRLLKDSGIRFVVFATNGSLMTEQRAKSVMKSGVDEVSFSVDGATKQTYEKIRVGLDFAEVVENIETFLRVRDEMNPETIVRIRMVAQKANENEIDQFLAFWNQRLKPTDSVYAKVLHTWGNSSKLHELPEGYDYEKLNASACTSPWTSMVIFSDGQVPLCCCDYKPSYSLGNVAEQSIREMWLGEKLGKIRHLHALHGRASIKMCRNCTTWDKKAKLKIEIGR